MKTLSVRFEEAPKDEIVLRLSPVPTSALLDILDAMSDVYLTRESMGRLCELFAPFVESWDYPQTVSAEGLLALDFNQLYVLVNRWVAEVRDAPPPLLVGSGDGVLLPASPAKPSPPSSPEPSSSTTF